MARARHASRGAVIAAAAGGPAPVPHAPPAVLEAVTYRYPDGAAPALREASLGLGGGLTHVWGPSGGGKSTLLRVLNGLVPHFHGGTWSGRATVCGLDVVASPTRLLARSVGFVFQDPERQAIAATVEREVAFALENIGLPPGEIASRIEEALDRAGALHLAGRRLDQLSGGERQRVEIAAAVALRPAILALDEPASQLDRAGAAAVAAACHRLAAEGLAVVVAEHRPLPGATRRVRVAGGVVMEVAPPAPAPPPPRMARPRPAAALTARGLVAGRAGVGIVDAGDLTVRRGEVLALVGDNGGGKSTLLRTLAGLERPVAGSLERPPGRTAYLPQDPAALLHRPTVAAEVAYTLQLARLASGPAAISAALRPFGLDGLASRYPRDLSGGQRERAALAAILAGDPSLVLLDEPTRGMDEPARDALVRALDGLAAQGAALVVATHDAGLASTADRIVEVGAGALRELPGARA